MHEEFRSEDGQSILVVEEGRDIATLRSAQGNPDVSVNILRPTVYAAISNHQKLIAIIVGHVTQDLYILRRDPNGKWPDGPDMITRFRKRSASMSWEETDDARYPPTKLIVKLSDGTQYTWSPTDSQ